MTKKIPITPIPTSSGPNKILIGVGIIIFLLVIGLIMYFVDPFGMFTSTIVTGSGPSDVSGGSTIIDDTPTTTGGNTIIPNALIARIEALENSATESAIILSGIARDTASGEITFPGNIKTIDGSIIAKSINTTDNTIQSNINNLRADKLYTHGTHTFRAGGKVSGDSGAIYISNKNNNGSGHKMMYAFNDSWRGGGGFNGH
jgi:hypothetical protein